MNKGMRRVYLVTTLALLLGGCASYAWIKPDATPEVMARDDASCRAEARDLAGEYA
jgi:PBP1b-binding outer membrane lipoprotein LpoB